MERFFNFLAFYFKKLIVSSNRADNFINWVNCGAQCAPVYYKLFYIWNCKIKLQKSHAAIRDIRQSYDNYATRLLFRLLNA